MIQDYKINAFQKTHTMLSNEPTETMSAAQLKAWWDSAPEELRVAHNGLADFIETYYATKAELSGIQLGQITNGTISEPKLDAALAQKVNDGYNAVNVMDNLYRQAIINGNFDVWQRGTSWTNPATLSFTADRWKFSVNSTGSLPTVTHSRYTMVSGELPGSMYAYRINTNGVGTVGTTDSYYIFQGIENGTRLLCGQGNKITVSFWAKSDIPNKKIGCFVAQFYGSGGSPSAPEIIAGNNFTLTSSWQKYSITITTNTLSGKTFGTNNDDVLQVILPVMWGVAYATGRISTAMSETFGGAGNVDIAQVQVCAGEQPTPFHPRSFATELELCQRYYEKSYDQAIAPGSASANGMLKTVFAIATAGSLFQNVAFKTRKRIAPTVTLYDGAGASGKVFKGADGKAAATDKVGESGFSGGSADTTNALELAFHYTADAEL